LIYLLALYESYLIFNNNYKDLLEAPKSRIVDVLDNFSANIGLIFFKVSEFIQIFTSTINKFLDPLHESISSIGVRIMERGKSINSNFYEKIDAKHGSKSEIKSKINFWILFGILICIVIWLPSVNDYTKVLQVSNFAVTLCIFLILALSLNLHKGMTGLINFGVIFFTAIGAIVVGILTAPSDLYGYDWPILPALIVAMIVGAVFGWFLAYPTARLRSDYFAIITISLGEIVKILLMGEPLLRAGGNRSAIGVQRYPLPFQEWWFCGSNPPLSSSGDKLSPVICSITPGIDSMAATVGNIIGLDQPAPYFLLLAILGLLGVAFTWKLLDILFESPWGRILRSIREDEEVAQHHGHDILKHKAASLALGAAICAFAGALYAWKLTGFQPSFMSPARSTFLVWAAFIIGGAANNRGMLIGAMIITLTEFFFNVLVAAQGSSSLPLADTADLIDESFIWLVEDPFQVAAILMILALIGLILRSMALAETAFWFSLVFIICGLIFDQRSIDLVFPEVLGGIRTQMTYFKLMLIGVLIMTSLKYNPKGLIPEEPYRPERPEEVDFK
jgi:neutral amino acid transport system permease protein